MKKLKEINKILCKDYKKLEYKVSILLKPYIGKEINIPYGKFKGRKGTIYDPYFDDFGKGRILSRIKIHRIKDSKTKYLTEAGFYLIEDKDLIK